MKHLIIHHQKRQHQTKWWLKYSNNCELYDYYQPKQFQLYLLDDDTSDFFGKKTETKIVPWQKILVSLLPLCHRNLKIITDTCIITLLESTEIHHKGDSLINFMLKCILDSFLVFSYQVTWTSTDFCHIIAQTFVKMKFLFVTDWFNHCHDWMPQTRSVHAALTYMIQ